MRTKPHGGLNATASVEVDGAAAIAAKQACTPGAWRETIAAAFRTPGDGRILEVLLARRTDQSRLDYSHDHQNGEKNAEPSHPVSWDIIKHRASSQDQEQQDNWFSLPEFFSRGTKFDSDIELRHSGWIHGFSANWRLFYPGGKAGECGRNTGRSRGSVGPPGWSGSSAAMDLADDRGRALGWLRWVFWAGAWALHNGGLPRDLRCAVTGRGWGCRGVQCEWIR